MIAYATPDDLAAWVGGDAPDNAAQLLRAATFDVAVATGGNPYTDTAPVPIPIRDATCAQVASWAVLAINPDAAGLDAPDQVTSRKSGDLEIRYEVPAARSTASALGVAARQAAANNLAPAAKDILMAAGLLALSVPRWPADIGDWARVWWA